MEGSMGRRTVLLALSLVIAALGTTLVFLYVSGVDNRAAADQQLVNVLVAQEAIPAGTTAADAFASSKLEEVARKDVAPGAVSDLRQISDQVALGPIFPGEQILAAKFGKAGAAGGLRETIPEGKLAMSVQLGDPMRVAGWLSPGSHVAVFINTPRGGSGPDITKVLLPDVEVLAVGGSSLVSTQESTSGSGQQVPQTLITLAVDQEQAQQLVFGTQHGQLYLALRSNSSKVTKLPPTDADSVSR
jgi:pilus assembly protein CpaB